MCSEALNSECSLCALMHKPVQLQIKDFPLGGTDLLGGVPTSDTGTFGQKQM